MPQKHAPSAALPLQPRVRVPQWLAPSTIPVEYLHSYGAGNRHRVHAPPEHVCKQMIMCQPLSSLTKTKQHMPNTCECPLTISPLRINSPLHRDREAHFKVPTMLPGPSCQLKAHFEDYISAQHFVSPCGSNSFADRQNKGMLPT